MPTTQHTPAYALAYLARGQAMADTRAVLQANAETIEAALVKTSAYVNQLATVIPGGQTFIGLDLDGRPYFDPAGSVSNPVGIGIDLDGRPYFVEWTP